MNISYKASIARSRMAVLGECVHSQNVFQIFEQQANATPLATAVVRRDVSLSYRELNEKANILSRRLGSLGVKPGVRVGLYLERSLDMIVALLAVLRAGGAYVPVDSRYPVERLHAVLEDSGATVLITDPEATQVVKTLTDDLGVITVTAGLELNGESICNKWPSVADVKPNDLAYLVYTSGSSGHPKAVMVEQHSLCDRIIGLQESYNLRSDDRILQFASISFDASMEEIFCALLSGGTLVLRDDSWVTGVEQFLNRCNEERVTVVDLPTRFWRLLAQDASTCIPECIRLVIIGGEAVDEAALLTWRQRSGYRPKLLNSYGPTETTIVASVEDLDRDNVSWRSIGHAVKGTEIYVLDSRGQPAPLDALGEIYIAGVGVARGYWNQPDVTSASFVPDPFSLECGSRMYRTGDVGRWTSEGVLEFWGRNDDQVKIRGYRIELGEVEARIRECPGVRDAAVVTTGSAEADKQLVAYYTTETDEISPQQLRAQLAALLPDYMVPAMCVCLPEIPATATGKVNREALPAPAFSSGTPFRAPANQEEKQLCEIFADILKVKAVGMDDDFFELGGHSLLVPRLFTRIRDVLGWMPSWQAVSRTLTPAVLSRNNGAPVREPLTLPQRYHRPDRSLVPLSFAQRRVWFIHELNPNETAYRFAATITFTGTLDVDALEKALNVIVERHEILRTTFHATEGEPVQRIHPFRPFTLRRYRGVSHGSSLDRLVEREILSPFQLDRLPLIRWALAECGQQDHVLIQVEHHLIHDGWSFNLLLAELTSAYNYYAGLATSLELPKLAWQFADYAVWEREWLETPTAERQLTYWKKQLAETNPEIRLPYDHPRVEEHAFQGSAIRQTLHVRLAKQLRHLCVREHVSLFMAMLSAFVVLLRRYSDQTDILVGTGFANRRLTDVHNVIGMFVNTLVLRCDASGNPTFRTLLRRTREMVASTFDNQECPLEKLVEILKPHRVAGMNPLFQTMFNCDDSFLEADEITGVRIAIQDPLNTGGAKVDLNVTIFPASGSRRRFYPDTGADDIRLIVEYNTTLFDRNTIVALIERYVRILESVVDDVEQRIDDIDIMLPSERDMVVHEWNDTMRSYPRDKCVHEVFEEQARSTPDALAVVCAGESLTYKALDVQANRIAQYLTGLDVKRDVPVAICMERSPEMIISVLAVLKAGGTYLPLSPSYPEDYLAYMLTESDPAALLTCGDTTEQVRSMRMTIPQIDVGHLLALPSQSDGDIRQLHRDVHPEHVAYIMYTSGSTGRPKGVMVPHRAITRLVLNNRYISIMPSDRIVFASNAAFDAATFEIWAPLLNGACVVVIDQHTLLESTKFVRVLQEYGATVLWLTVGLFNQYADDLAGRLAHLRYLIVGGDALDPRVIARMLQTTPPEHLINGYGPTETTTFATTHEIETVPRSARIPIGRPISNTRVYILDEHGRPVPVGVVGELFIGGDGVSRGYFRQPELTAERFIPDIYAEVPGQRMYRSGDVGRWLPNGTIDFLGRNDHQVKVRGFRIELQDIERRLMEHADVKEAIVAAVDDARLGKQLVAYYISEKPEPTVGAVELDAYLRSRIPDYMLPAAYVRLHAMPLSYNGKIDRNRLPQPEDDAYVKRSYEEPKGEIEKAIAAIWGEMLQLDQVGSLDNFFALGGHSLLAMRVISQIRNVLGVQLGVQALFEHPILRELADHIQRGKVNTGEREAISRRSQESGTFPLSFNQDGQLVHECFARLRGIDLPALHISFNLRLEGNLDCGALEHALQELTIRHEILRASFPNTTRLTFLGKSHPLLSLKSPDAFRRGIFMQEIHSAVPVRVDVRDFTNPLVTARSSPDLSTLLAREVEVPFDYEKAPLMRASLFITGNKEYILSIAVHHLICDGWSLRIFKRDLELLYESYLHSQSTRALPALTVGYADFAIWERRRLDGDVLHELADYWKPRWLKYKTAQFFALPRVRAASATLFVGRPSHHTVAIDTELSRQIQEFMRIRDLTAYMVFLGALAVALHDYALSPRIAIWSHFANRPRPETQDLIGWFSTSHLLGVDVSPNDTFAQLLQQVREVVLGALTHQSMPSSLLQSVLKQEEEDAAASSVGASVLFDVDIRPTEISSLDAGNLTIRPQPSLFERFYSNLLEVTLSEESHTFALKATYTDALDGDGIRMLLEKIPAIIKASVNDPSSRLSKLFSL